MREIQVLDCTLRDGGYINSWKFGQKRIQSIVSGLIEANVDYIECGYFNNEVNKLDHDITQFKDEEQLVATINDIRKIRRPVAMFDFGKFDVTHLEDCTHSSLFGIRLAFHKQDMKKIGDCCHAILEKGYRLFLQPMVTVSYTDEELLELVRMTNELKPYAFYIVDSFGSLKESDLQRMLFLVDHNLNDNIILGFHSHNNLQLAYSNAQIVVQLQTNRSIIIDSCIFGMGRGAGNLNTELFVQYLNDYYSGNYRVKPLLQVMDNTLNSIYREKYWGYSLAYYISAVYNCHPNYAHYLSEKNSLFSDDIESIISKIDGINKESYSDEYAEKIYLAYMKTQKDYDKEFEALADLFANKKVLVLGPGRSALEHREQIQQLIRDENIISVSLNCIHKWLDEVSDYIFVSNKRRFEQIPKNLSNKLIITSNIECEEAAYRIPYEKLINNQDGVEDNGGMMFLQLMIFFNVQKVYIVGVDGFSYDMDENYFIDDMKFSLSKERMHNINCGMKKLIKNYMNFIEIEFLEMPQFLKEKL